MNNERLNEISQTPLSICTQCGNVVESELTDFCPRCGHKGFAKYAPREDRARKSGKIGFEFSGETIAGREFEIAESFLIYGIKIGAVLGFIAVVVTAAGWSL